MPWLEAKEPHRPDAGRTARKARTMIKSNANQVYDGLIANRDKYRPGKPAETDPFKNHVDRMVRMAYAIIDAYSSYILEEDEPDRTLGFDELDRAVALETAQAVLDHLKELDATRRGGPKKLPLVG